MPSASGSGSRRRAGSPPTAPPAAREQQQHPPRCPRCDSPDTKFCYYNNYNLTQPRHLCKSCRRYWTLGGALRNIPVGGACRKAARASSPSSSAAAVASSKRRRCNPAAPSCAPPPAAVDHHKSQAPLLLEMQDDPIADAAAMPDDQIADAADVAGTFGALLAEPLPAGLLALGDPFSQGRAGLELELGLSVSGMEDIGFGLGRTAGWPFLGDEVEGSSCNGTAGDNPWQAPNVGGSGDGDGVVGGADGGCFAWSSDLTISSALGKGRQE